MRNLAILNIDKHIANTNYRSCDSRTVQHYYLGDDNLIRPLGYNYSIILNPTTIEDFKIKLKNFDGHSYNLFNI